MRTTLRCLSYGCLLLLAASAGCQSLSSSGMMPGLAEAKREKQIVRLATNDPFPSPSDVGLKLPK